MGPCCFENTYNTFSSLNEYEAFDKELTIKLSQNKLITGTPTEYLGVYCYTYKCCNCGATFWLSDPDHAWRGFFLIEDVARLHVESIRKRDSRIRSTGCFWLLVILIVVSTIIFNKIFNP
jgi:hypothetical protein